MPCRRTLLVALLAAGTAMAGCAADGGDGSADAGPDASTTTTGASAGATVVEPPPTTLPEAGTDEEIALRFARSVGPTLDLEAADLLTATGDSRWAWLLADALRFFGFGSPESAALTGALGDLTGFAIDELAPWSDATDQLIDADVDAPPDYELLKRIVFGSVDPRWTEMLTGVVGLDLRHVGWGGVFPDDRELEDPNPCQGRGCIPALDEPAVTDAVGGDWYDDESVIFGLVVAGEARAYPKNVMEVHEMVNDTLGGRHVAIPYCTLCGSAQAYLTDDVAGADGRLVLRTSGLLQRSNKVMVDLNTLSLWDTFEGTAGSGPLGAAGVELDQLTVEVSTWGDWKSAHPGTTIVASDGGIGRTYPLDPLRGRDDDGPIFPIGEVDPRLPVQEQVVAVEGPGGVAVAFPAAPARAALDAGTAIELGGVTLSTDGGGFRASDGSGAELVAHQAFWFAWVQRNPDTLLWEPRL